MGHYTLQPFPLHTLPKIQGKYTLSLGTVTITPGIPVTANSRFVLQNETNSAPGILCISNSSPTQMKIQSSNGSDASSGRWFYMGEY